MLPHIKKNSLQQLKQSQLKSTIATNKNYSLKNNQPKIKLSNSQPNSINQKQYNTNQKIKGITKQNTIINQIRYLQNSQKIFASSTLSEEIRQIQKKIRLCQKRIRAERRKSLQQKQTIDTRKQIDLDLNKFDFLTNPGQRKQEQQTQEKNIQTKQQSKPSNSQNPYFIKENIEKLDRHYNKSLRKKFQRRQTFPHKFCKKKNPKLYITKQTNTIEKTGKPSSYEEHIFRVLTKQVTPQQIYATIPTFSVVKDNVAKNIMAYLIDYKPFIQKTKQQFPLIQEQKQNSNKIQDENTI